MVASGQSLVLEYSSIVLTVLIFIMTGCDCQDPDPCQAAIRNTEPWRDVTVSNNADEGQKCDKGRFLPNQWYSFQIGNEAAMIPTTCVKSHRCGATIGMRIHLDGQAMPEQGEYVTASLCGSYNVLGSYDCCVLRTSVTIFKCKNNDYVYKFHSPIDRCSAAICTQKIHEDVPKHATALMGDPHPDRLNNSASGNEEVALAAAEGESEQALPDRMEDESLVDVGNSTQQQTGTNGTDSQSPVISEANISSQGEANTTGTTQTNDVNNNNGNSTTFSDITDTGVISTTTSSDTSLSSTVPNQLTPSSSNQTSDTSTSTTATTEKEEILTSTNAQDTSSKDHLSPLATAANATTETAQITNKDITPSANATTSSTTTTTTTTKDSLQTNGSEIFNTSTPRPGRSSPPSSPSPTPPVTNSSSLSTSTSSTTSSSNSTTLPASALTTTVPRIATIVSTVTTTTTTAVNITSASTTIPLIPSSLSTQPTTTSSSTSASPPSSPSADSEPPVSSSSSPPTRPPSMTQFQTSSISQSSSTSPPPPPSMAQSSSPTTQSSSSVQSSSFVIISQPPLPPNHEVIMIESVRFVFLGGFWDTSFSQQVIVLLTYFLNRELTARKAVDSSLDTWFDITELGTGVEDRNETTHIDTRISHAWPEKILYLFETPDFADFLYDEGNLTLLVACRPSTSCGSDDDYTDYTMLPTNPPHDTPKSSSSSSFDKNLPVLIAVTTLCAFCLVVMVIGVTCAKCRKKRRSWNAGSDAEKKSLKDNRPNWQGTPSPFTDHQIMSDEEAADGSANGSAVDGGETMQDNSWVVPLEDIELEEVNKDVVAEATEDTKF